MERETAQRRYPEAGCFTFGDTQELCADLNGLVRAGSKTATCAALRDYPSDARPQVGSRGIALHWDQTAALVIEVSSVDIMRFCDVPEDFALAEGQSDYAAWRTLHEAYFERNGGFDPEMQILCVRFRMLEDFDGA